MPSEERTLRVLFLNPPHREGGVWMKEVGRCGRKAIGGEVWPQTGLAYLGAMVEREGAPCRIIDGMAEPMNVSRLVETCREWRPDLIVANSATPTLLNDASILADLAEATGAWCGFTGPHISALPVETLRETGIDFGLVNEAEESVVDLFLTLRRLVRGNSGRIAADLVREGLGKVEGLVWRAPGGISPASVTESARLPLRERLGYPLPKPIADDASDEVFLNSERPLVADLNDLPLPARHLLPNHAYRMPFFQNHP
ncbi:cobalamin B12-binding domain-containing protein, partial [bacterium]|nr:cobalamin B12-binding domain-containing protein [bacterium]